MQTAQQNNKKEVPFDLDPSKSTVSIEAACTQAPDGFPPVGAVSQPPG
jgi:hypothetical protein